ncbi:MAG: ABC transporter ATP-binding protein [Myxococcales bacterium]|nr:ABC transporter ATP-binding protein [Myxococcales bacterium]
MSRDTPAGDVFAASNAPPDAALLRQLVPFIRPHARLLFLNWLLVPLTVAFELAQPYIVKLAFVDHIAAGKPEGLARLLMLFAALVVLQGISSYFEQWTVQLLGQRTMHDLRLAAYDHIMRQRASFFDRVAVGRLTTRITSDIENINEMFAQGVVTIFADTVRMIGILVIMFTIDFRLSLVVLATFPFLYWVVAYARNAMRGSFRAIRQRIAAMNGHAYEHLAGIRIVQTLGRGPAATAEFDVLNAGHRDAYLDSIRADSVMYAVVEMIGVLAIAAVGVWIALALRVDHSTIATVGVVILFIEYCGKFFMPIRDLSAKYTVLQSATAALERLRQLLTHHEPDAPVIAAPAPAQTPPEPGAHIEFSHVGFGYRDGEPILRDVSLTVAPKQTIAIVGATGSGKSTIIKLLTRLYECDAGHIYLGGRDITSIAGGDLRRRISVISQDAFFIAGTLRENIALGADIADDAIAAALATLGAQALFAARGLSLDSPIDERGGNLSAGERQIVAFARALVRQSDVLVLDEATAHIDPEAEQAIERGLAALARQQTSIIIAHRLSTIARADLVLVMQRGEIVERGTYDELVAAGGAFAALQRSFAAKTVSLPAPA